MLTVITVEVTMAVSVQVTVGRFWVCREFSVNIFVSLKVAPYIQKFWAADCPAQSCVPGRSGSSS